MPQEHILKFISYTPEELSLCCNISSETQKQCLSCKNIIIAQQRISDATDALEHALHEGIKARNRRNAHHSHFSCLPTEIACRIFSFCFPAIPTPTEFHRMERRFRHDIPYQQLVFGAVCKDWRHIIWSNPSFWRFIVMTMNPSTPSWHSIIVRDWLERSASLPLVIRLSIRDTFRQDQVFEVLDPLIEIINNVADRWHCVAFHIPNSYFSKLRSTGPSSIKALTLHPLDDRPANIRQTDRQGVTVFRLGHAPSPSHLKVDGCQLRTLDILWYNMIWFEGEGHTLAEVLDVLKLSPLMKECTVKFHNFEDSSASLPTIVHSSLRTLRLEGDITSVLSRITCPALQELVLTSDGTDVQCECLCQFIVRSGFSLVFFSMTGMLDSDDDEDWIRVLSLLPALEELCLVSQVGQPLFDHLAETAFTQGDEQHRRFLPRLHTFRFAGYRDFLWSSMAAMAPLQPPSPTHTVRRPLSDIVLAINYDYESGNGSADDAIGSDTIDRSEIEKILVFKNNGLDISITEEYGNIDVLRFWTEFYGMDHKSSSTTSTS